MGFFNSAFSLDSFQVDSNFVELHICIYFVHLFSPFNMLLIVILTSLSANYNIWIICGFTSIVFLLCVDPIFLLHI